MCGIIGSTNPHFSTEVLASCLHKINHRGPDETVLTNFTNTSVTFGMKRLAVRDLHPHLYPFSYRHYRLIINGEIYNISQIKKFIPNFKPLTNCDSELILPLYHRYGVKCFDLLTGMFAIAILDLQKNEIIVARDKFGEKPLYYSTDFNSLFFASETTAFPSQYQNIDQNIIPQYLTFGFIPYNHTFNKFIKKLLPGSYLKYSLKNHTIVTKSFYQPHYNLTSQKPVNINKLTNKLDQDLNLIIQQKMVADVPVGIFLSGGLDSSLITAIAQKYTSKTINTYSVGFSETDVDESIFSQQVANFLGTKHHHLIVTSKDISDNWEKIIKSFDEPISDPAIFPTYFLSKLAKKEVTVVLSGEGADEIFGGYPAYQKEFITSRFHFLNLPPFPIPLKYWRIFSSIKSHYTQTIYQSLWQNSQDSRHLYYQLISRNWQDFLNQLHFLPLSINNIIPQIIQVHDLNNYLSEQLCMKVDKMTMQNSLECRAPFLDEKLIKYLTPSARLLQQNYPDKYLLRQVAQKYLPKGIYSRPKHGFALPLNQWLNNELKTYVDDLYSPHPLISTNISSNTIKNLISEFTTSGANEMTIWNLVFINTWLKLHSI